MKNILMLTVFGGLLILFGALGFIVNAQFLVPAAVMGVYTPEMLSEID